MVIICALKNKIKESQTEGLVITDSKYSDGTMDCLIACTERNRQLNRECFRHCIKNRWKY
jgi:hypothetical protein